MTTKHYIHLADKFLHENHRDRKFKIEEEVYLGFKLIFILYSAIICYFGGLIILIPIFISIYTATKCHDIAYRKKENTRFAFLIGMVFGLFGLLAYYLIYRKSKK